LLQDPPAADAIKAAFEKADADKSGKLEPAEAKEAAKELGYATEDDAKLVETAVPAEGATEEQLGKVVEDLEMLKSFGGKPDAPITEEEKLKTALRAAGVDEKEASDDDVKKEFEADADKSFTFDDFKALVAKLNKPAAKEEEDKKEEDKKEEDKEEGDKEEKADGDEINLDKVWSEAPVDEQGVLNAANVKKLILSLKLGDDAAVEALIEQFVVFDKDKTSKLVHGIEAEMKKSP